MNTATQTLCPQCGGAKEIKINNACRCESSRSSDGYKSKYSDTDRLDWLMRHITGSELRDMGLDMSWTGDINEIRQLIDKKLDL